MGFVDLKDNSIVSFYGYIVFPILYLDLVRVVPFLRFVDAVSWQTSPQSTLIHRMHLIVSLASVYVLKVIDLRETF